jgi:hypothetical protein
MMKQLSVRVLAKIDNLNSHSWDFIQSRNAAEDATARFVKELGFFLMVQSDFKFRAFSIHLMLAVFFLSVSIVFHY